MRVAVAALSSAGIGFHFPCTANMLSLGERGLVMSKTYRTVIAVTLERPIDEADKRSLETHIVSAIKSCDGGHHAVVPFFGRISEVEVSELKDADLSEVRARGGRARAEKLSPGQRSEIARLAAQARWEKGR